MPWQHRSVRPWAVARRPRRAASPVVFTSSAFAPSTALRRRSRATARARVPRCVDIRVSLARVTRDLAMNPTRRRAHRPIDSSLVPIDRRALARARARVGRASRRARATPPRSNARARRALARLARRDALAPRARATRGATSARSPARAARVQGSLARVCDAVYSPARRERKIDVSIVTRAPVGFDDRRRSERSLEYDIVRAFRPKREHKINRPGAAEP